MSRLLVIGADGFVGAHLARISGGHGVDQRDCDITRREQVRAVLEHMRPDAVALVAALSDIDRCEREPDLAERVNMTGSVNVAHECARIGARLLFTSTAAIFDGAKHGYREDDPPSPLSVYGRTKAAAETQIRDILPAALIVRLALAVGFGLRPGTNSFVDKLEAGLRAGRPVAVPVEEYRNPIDVVTLCRIAVDLIESDQAGIFHVGSLESISRFDLARSIAEKLGYPGSLVAPQNQVPPGRAPRGRDHWLLPHKLRGISPIRIPTCAEVVERCVHAIA